MSNQQICEAEALLTNKMLEMGKLKVDVIIKERKIVELEAKVWALEKEKGDFVEARRQLMKCWEYKDGAVGVKRFGEIDITLFQKAVGSKFMCTDDGHVPVAKIKELCSFWQNKISDPNWRPFKLVPVSGDQERQVQKKAIDPEDGYLKMLRIHLGEEACALVISALEEMNKYNPIERSPVVELWNFAEKRKATFKEAIHEANFQSQRKRFKMEMGME